MFPHSIEASSSVNATVKNTARGVSIESETDISPLGSLLRSITNPPIKNNLFLLPPSLYSAHGWISFLKRSERRHCFKLSD